MDLKAHLSRYLRLARRGSEVQVLERGVPIARLVGLREAVEGDDKARVDRLVRGGVLRRGSGDLTWILREAPISAPGANLSGAVEEDRGDRV
jgi:antitoxin (DNA-binding transcriptional repressor) of toxin-antitoxin stability system